MQKSRSNDSLKISERKGSLNNKGEGDPSIYLHCEGGRDSFKVLKKARGLPSKSGGKRWEPFRWRGKWNKDTFLNKKKGERGPSHSIKKKRGGQGEHLSQIGRTNTVHPSMKGQPKKGAKKELRRRTKEEGGRKRPRQKVTGISKKENKKSLHFPHNEKTGKGEEGRGCFPL